MFRACQAIAPALDINFDQRFKFVTSEPVHSALLPAYSAQSVRERGQQYFVDPEGNRLPSVTTILNATKPSEDWERLLNWRQRVGPEQANQISATASRRGTGTHRQIQRYLQGQPVTCSESVQPYWISVEPVLQEIQAVRLVEGPVFHYDLQYAGKVDCIASYRGVPCLCEWKTADRPRGDLEYCHDYPLQVAAYCGAINHCYADQGVNLSHALLAIALPDRPAEVFWLDPPTLAHYWNQWQQRVTQFQNRRRWN